MFTSFSVIKITCEMNYSIYKTTSTTWCCHRNDILWKDQHYYSIPSNYIIIIYTVFRSYNTG